ncbi:PQQ-dependent dehydrogenase, methanol/ethanol family [Novosphingobium sp. JCM 18896]|uniref:PQQ-dependent dehydrogenase, methanol/ethanol family n=1 Tax=Novosphingobium sp. JCM 18896 TaxID=2989731 RepID=UPI0022216ABA|nr:PQQ-dependent dehydrogenase, methanol/ethanol family [Novosphingobium sp. JCM 18896]MCW1428303.1 PQQ-dependent dehydrogenase, methanol/ethanol family [Novosphingobium sp. JCM 18896]
MHRLKMTILAAAASTALLAAGCTKGAGEAAQPEAGVGTDQNWAAVGGGADETSYSRLTEIGTGNVDKLGLAWSLDLPGEVTLEATPLAVDGKIYFPGSYAAVYAVDAVTGKQLWKFDPETWKHNPDKMHFSFGANRGVAYENGKIFVAGLDCRLFALDAATGKQLWVTETTPAGSYNICTGAPRTFKGKVIIGNGGADFGARGFVTAFDGNTGKQVWRFYTTPGTAEQNKGDPAMEAAAKTWGADFTKNGGGGGTAWNGITFDAELNRIYIGAGNAGAYDPLVRDPGSKGDNLYTSSIVAVDADTGKYVWHYQENPRDSWDYKATPNIQTATLQIDGKPRKVIMHAPTNGLFYLIDRETGKLINQPGKTTLVNWVKDIDMKTGRPNEEPNIRYETGLTEIWPGTIGGHNWQAMSYSPRTGLVYIPIQQIGARFSKRGDASENAFNVMGLLLEPIKQKEGDGHGFLVAWDPVAQKEAWRVKNDNLWNGGTLATAGGLVFQGTAEGTFNAYNAKSGERVWQFNAGLGIVGAPMSFSVNGKQYVSILVGYGGTTAAYGDFMNVGWKYGVQPRRLLTFAIGGTAKLEATPGPDMKVHAVDDPAYVINEADVAAGKQLAVSCAACHGIALQATGTPGPDLRESAIALQLDTLTQLLKTGPLMDRGMPKFDKLTDVQIRQIHAYIRAKAREQLGLRQKDNSRPGNVKL